MKGQTMLNRRRRGSIIPNSLLAAVRQEILVETKEKNERVARTKELRAWGKGEACQRSGPTHLRMRTSASSPSGER